MLEMKCLTKTCRTKTSWDTLKHTDMSALNVSRILAQRGNFSMHWDVVCRYSSMKTHSNWQVLEQISTPYKEKPVCGTKILGTQLLRTTQMCQGSMCHVVAQHGDISKLHKALLLTWEVCATIAIKTPKEISECYVPKKTRQTKANQQRQHLWHKDSWDTTVDYLDVPMSGSQGTCLNGQPLGSPDSGPVSGSTCLSSSTACLVNRLDKTTLLTRETVQICKFNIWYLRCHAGDEMSNCITKMAQRGNFSMHWDVVCRYSSMKTHFQLTSSRTNFNTLQRKTCLWHKDSWDTTVEDYTDVSGVNVSCCCTAWRYQHA